jgi:hypothetical protein
MICFDPLLGCLPARPPRFYEAQLAWVSVEGLLVYCASFPVFCPESRESQAI